MHKIITVLAYLCIICSTALAQRKQKPSTSTKDSLSILIQKVDSVITAGTIGSTPVYLDSEMPLFQSFASGDVQLVIFLKLLEKQIDMATLGDTVIKKHSYQYPIISAYVRMHGNRVVDSMHLAIPLDLINPKITDQSSTTPDDVKKLERVISYFPRFKELQEKKLLSSSFHNNMSGTSTPIVVPPRDRSTKAIIAKKKKEANAIHDAILREAKRTNYPFKLIKSYQNTEPPGTTIKNLNTIIKGREDLLNKIKNYKR